MLDPACLFAFADKHVHETVVPLAIKQACTRALKLVAHAASAPDLDVEVLGKALDCTRTGLSQSPAAIPAWHRVGDDIDSQRADLDRPFGAPPEIGRAHVRTPVTNAHLVRRPLLQTPHTHTPLTPPPPPTNQPTSTTPQI